MQWSKTKIAILAVVGVALMGADLAYKDRATLTGLVGKDQTTGISTTIIDGTTDTSKFGLNTFIINSSSNPLAIQGLSGSPGTPSGGILTIQGVTGMTPVTTTSTSTGVKSSLNSTTAQLAASATFTGTGESVLPYQNIQLSGRSDQAGTYKVQWSNDNSTFFDDDSVYTLAAGATFKVSYGRAFQFFRASFTNTGGSTTTTFFLSVIYDGQRPKPSSSRTGDPVGMESDAELVKASLTGVNLTADAPTFATVGLTSASISAADANVKGFSFTNTSGAIISLGFSGNAAVLRSGVTLYPGDSYGMEPLDSALTGAVSAIASVASSNLAIQRWK